MDESSSASFLDKTDWRITIHRKLEACVNAEGTLFYSRRVKSLISAVSATYPGWNAKDEVLQQQKKLESYYNNMWNVWLLEHSTARRWQKHNKITNIIYRLHKDMFEYIKDMCARKRMLLWGTKQVEIGYDG